MITPVREFWRSHFLGLELLVAIVATVAAFAWNAHTHYLTSVLQGNRDAVYGTLASIEGVLLGLVIASVTIVLGFADSPQFAILRGSQHYTTLWTVFTSAIRALGLATFATFIALILDRDVSHNLPAMLACFGTSIWAGLRVWRVTWVLRLVIAVVVIPGAK
jgi:hypothetical protein